MLNGKVCVLCFYLLPDFLCWTYMHTNVVMLGIATPFVTSYWISQLLLSFKWCTFWRVIYFEPSGWAICTADLCWSGAHKHWYSVSSCSYYHLHLLWLSHSLQWLKKAHYCVSLMCITVIIIIIIMCITHIIHSSFSLFYSDALKKIKFYILCWNQNLCHGLKFFVIMNHKISRLLKQIIGASLSKPHTSR